MVRVTYLGPEGTNTHAAALALHEEALREAAQGGAPLEFVPEATIRGVFEAVAAGRADRGVVPIENSTEGGVALCRIPSKTFRGTSPQVWESHTSPSIGSSTTT